MAPKLVRTAAGQTAVSGPWIAPADAKAVKDPVPPTPANIAAGKMLYTNNCVLCHGEKGDGQGLMGSSLDPKPANFADPKLMAMTTDGELFWKMTVGRGVMIPWKDKLSENERWQLVRYIRTFAKAGAKPAAKN
jgi:mono/diheme cytochrome c family protein